MVSSTALRKVVVGAGTAAVVAISIITSGTVHVGRLPAHVLRACGSMALFASASLALAIHRSYPKRHDLPSDFSELLTEGPYRVCRHPFYLLLIVAQFSISLSMLSLWGLLTAAALIPLWVLLIRLEEKELITYWGERYLEYMERVPMLIPVLRKVGKRSKSS